MNGTTGGTICSVLPMLNSEEIMRTIALAAIGALVSFVVTFLIKAYFKQDK
ncbi:hypothetical protein [Mesonia maritima]|uniref:Mannitol-specific phosphotransferase system IIBC component n=1 Tax=Mesonia maritima TaxID=1793873 RepID=A0ABU1K872_9FLAO|nr:hypothetical protein [Mesonia maritima]MDR6301822.1 mannitol-specific phosphotransferase system IIBC component [Mesonia maritima]